MLEHDADLGIGLDGDADRCLAVDHEGSVIDGDQILAILALALKDDHALHSDTVVATVMSNLGFINAMREHGVRVDQTKVGDRYVLEAMNAHGFALGGEQSGHVIMSQFATTGDGVLTALHLAARMVRTGRTLKDLAAVMTRLPQVMINVPGVNKVRAGIDPDVSAAVSAASRELGDTGRVLLRPSGTEPLVRVMVEAPTQEQAQAVAERLAGVVRTGSPSDRPDAEGAGPILGVWRPPWWRVRLKSFVRSAEVGEVAVPAAQVRRPSGHPECCCRHRERRRSASRAALTGVEGVVQPGDLIEHLLRVRWPSALSRSSKIWK